MTGYEPTPELIEAAAKAIHAKDCGCPDFTVNGSDTDDYTELGRVAAAVVVPLIREQIAAEIEAIQLTGDDYGVVVGRASAARVARGEDR